MPSFALSYRFVWALLMFGAGVATAPSAGFAVDDTLETARFSVTETVLQNDMRAFTATIGAAGNRLFYGLGGFEPQMVRERIVVREDATDRVVSNAADLTVWESFREGLYDGAEVEILRVENGAWRSVRRDVVAPGGHASSGWTRAHRDMVPTTDSTFFWHLSGAARPNAPIWFSVSAYDRQGRLSAPSEAVSARTPAQQAQPNAPKTDLVIAPQASGHQNRAARVAPPTNIRARTTREGVIVVSWDAPRGPVAGYKVFRSSHPPHAHRGYALYLEKGGPEIKRGDIAIIRQRITEFSRSKYTADRIWNVKSNRTLAWHPLVRSYSDEPEGGLWSLEPHPKDTPVADPGETFLRLTYSQGDGTQIGNFTYGSTDQVFWPVLEPGKPYRIDLWIRGKSSGPGRISMSGPYSQSEMFTVPITETWTRHIFEFAVGNWSPTGLGDIFLTFPGTGTVDIDNFRVYRGDAPFQGWQPEDLSELQRSGMSFLRYHGLIKQRWLTYDLRQLLAPAGVTSAQVAGNTLPQMLQLTEQAGMDPWLQIEPHLSAEEWLGLVEYLAAPFRPGIDAPEDLPWAFSRVAQGRLAPWTDAFDTLLFEIGNETWNGLFRPWVFDAATDAVTGKHIPAGGAYGLYQEYVLSILRQSPHWARLKDKLVPVLGGHAIGNYGFEAAEASPSSEYMTVAAYNGGWDSGEGPPDTGPASFFNILNRVSQQGRAGPKRHVAGASKIGERQGRVIGTGSYEAGPGYVMNGLNGQSVSDAQSDAQERAMKSKAAATATLDSFLNGSVEGYSLHNFFTFDRGALWKSHALAHNGGQAYPSWKLLSLFNREALGDLLRVDTIETPTADLKAFAWREDVTDAPLSAVYATRNQDRLSVVAISRRVPGFPNLGDDGRTRMEIELPITGAESGTLFRMTGAFDAHNVTGDNVRIVSEVVEGPRPDGLLVIPILRPGETLIYVFDGVDPK